ncbi:MAG: MYG1 family protein [Cellulosilyticaceae bacterium]
MTKMAVHSGVFHADEVFGVAIMKDIIDDLEVIRTRDEAVIASCDIAADVGGGQYDHHQADKKLREDGIPYCAFGLLWQDFGPRYVRQNFPELTDETQIDEVVAKIAKDFITQIDASDNGVDVNTYEVPVTTISHVISSFMPFGGTQEEVQAGFEEAVAFGRKFFFKTVRKAVEYYGNYNYVKAQLEAQDVAQTHYLVLEKTVGWKDPVFKLDTQADVLFVVFEDISGSWRVQAVQKEAKSFESRKDLPKHWAGERDEAMTAMTGVAGCIFCHPARFICGNQTKAGAIALAEQAVAYEEPKVINVRAIEADDTSKVYDVVQTAFASAEHADGTEQDLVVRLRADEKAYVPELELVAEQDGQIVGHVLFTKAAIAEDGKSAETLALAPLAVLPDLQKSGVGTALVNVGLERAKALGYKHVIVLGSDQYYPRFGFKEAAQYGVKAPFEVPSPYFMALELEDGALDGVQGVVVYSPAFMG